MKSTGIIRRIDDLGRIVIPMEIRKNFKIEEGTSIEIFVEEEKIVLAKSESSFCECGEIVDVEDKFCRNCGRSLKC